MVSFKIEELSAVDKPAQEGAVAVIMKRDDKSKKRRAALVDKICKAHAKAYGGEPVSVPPPMYPQSGGYNSPGAKAFDDLLQRNVDDQALQHLIQECWPLFTALDTSLRSIIADANLSDDEKVKMMRTSADQFIETVKEKLPNIEGYLEESALYGDTEKRTSKMNLRQLKKEMDSLGNKLDVVVTKLKARQKRADDDDDLEKVDDDDDDDIIKSRRRVAKEEDDDDDEEAASERLSELFGSKGKSRKADDMEEAMMGKEDEEEEDDEDDDYEMGKEGEEEVVEVGEKRKAKGRYKGEGEDEDFEMGRRRKAEGDPGEATTEGEEEDAIAAGDTRPIGGGKKRASKRVRIRDETIKVGKRTVFKSAVGEDMFAILKAQNAEMERLEKMAQDERDARELLELSKTAESEIPSLPGTTDQKARLLKSLSSLDDDDRRLLTKMLRAGDRSLSAAFRTVGHGGSRQALIEKGSARTSFNKRVSEIKARDACTGTEAMQKARKEYPEEYEDFQSAN